MTLRQAIEFKPHPQTFICIPYNKATINDITIQGIEKEVCYYLNTDAKLLQGKCRERGIVKARQIIMYMSCKLTKLSLREIGNHFGGYDHTTVIHARKNVQNMMDTEPDYNADVTYLMNQFKTVRV